jgi:hypothetical protein
MTAVEDSEYCILAKASRTMNFSRFAMTKPVRNAFISCSDAANAKATTSPPSLFERFRPVACSSIISIALILCFPVNTRAELQLGPITFAYPPAEPLLDRTTISDGLQSLAFLGTVGGVAFGGIAEGVGTIQVTRLQYSSSLPDGERLLVTMIDDTGKEQIVKAPIYDWQLIPIAHFAKEDQHVLVTLFGKLVDPLDNEIQIKNGHRIANYHPSLTNTLLGLRFLQADSLLLQDDPQVLSKGLCCDLPKIDGKYVLANGENAPDYTKNLESDRQVAETLRSLISNSGRFRSYLITDYQQPVTFATEEGQLLLTGYPLWYCWRLKIDNDAILTELAATLRLKAKERLQEEYRWDSRELTLEKLKKKYTTKFKEERAKRIYNNLWLDAITADDLQKLEEMMQFSLTLSESIREADGINPEVYRSLLTTMRYAAFFRYVRTRNPETYSTFVTALPGASLLPSIQTPTVLVPKDDLIRSYFRTLHKGKPELLQ